LFEAFGSCRQSQTFYLKLSLLPKSSKNYFESVDSGICRIKSDCHQDVFLTDNINKYVLPISLYYFLPQGTLSSSQGAQRRIFVCFDFAEAPTLSIVQVNLTLPSLKRRFAVFLCELCVQRNPNIK